MPNRATSRPLIFRRGGANDDATRSPFAAVKRIKLSKDLTDLVDREMQYDAAGNVTKIVDGVNSETVDYTYDDLDRLLTASVPTGESFAYDTIGNMTAKAGTTLDYGTTSPKHAVKSHGTTAYTYDANGSMTARGTQTTKYDPEQRPILVQDGTSIHRAAYDGDGVRRKRDDSNGTVHYLGGYERKLAGGANSSDTVTKYYSASLGAMSRPVAFRRGGTLHWVGADHLGGTIRVLNDSFTALDGMRYKPYGEDRDAGTSLNTDRKFTGQTEDEAAGLYWYASRAYDPAIGRFVSPDSIVPAPGNPQSLNRYSYVRNNPLGFVDPTGQTREQEGWDSDWAEEYASKHGGQWPNWQDWMERQHSLVNPGSGPDGGWTNQDWEASARRKAYLDEVLNPTIQPSNPVGPRPRRTPTRGPTTSPKLTPEPQPAPTPTPRPTGTPTPAAAPQPEKPSPQIVRKDGVEIVEYADGFHGDLLRLTGGERNTFVLSQDQIHSTYDVSNHPDILAHEWGHIEQAELLGPAYLPAYMFGYGVTAVTVIGLAVMSKGATISLTGMPSPETFHKLHPMEIDANLRAEYPPFWPR